MVLLDASRLTALFIASAALGPVAASAAHFDSCTTSTGVNATLVVPADAALLIDGIPIGPGDELAVYTSDGICAGAGIWNGENLAITVWGDDVVTAEKDGLYSGEAISFRLWDSANSVEVGGIHSSVQPAYAADQPYYTSDGVFRENGIYVLDGINFTRSAADHDSWKSVDVERQNPGDVPLSLAPNYPNPFNPSTTISYTLGQESNVRLSVLNVLGQTVRVLVDGRQSPGTHAIDLDMAGMPSGLYLYRIESELHAVTRTMLLSK